jgi:hypothetical protein
VAVRTASMLALTAGSVNRRVQCRRCVSPARLGDFALLHVEWAATRLSRLLSGCRDRG